MLVNGTTRFNVNIPALGGGANGAEVVAHDAARSLLFVLGADGVDALDAATGTLRFSIPKSLVVDGGGAPVALGTANSVAVSGDTLAVAFDGPAPATNGTVAAFTLGAQGANFRAAATVGAVPDHVTFTPDGQRLLVAIEGEPSPGYAEDPPGGMAIIDVATWTVRFFGFEAFDAQADALRAAGVKIANGIGGENTALPSTDFEPEYIAVSGGRAFVTLQENNAVAVFDLAAERWVSVLPLGFSDHSLPGNGIDPSDRDGGPNIRTVPVLGMYQPDGIAAFERDGVTFLVTANEGDARDYGGRFSEEVRVSQLVPATGSAPSEGMPPLSPALLAAVQGRRADADLGRLTVSKWAGDLDGDGQLDALVAFGARSFSIWEVGGTAEAPTITQRYNSGQLIDELLASRFPALFDDSRSDNKGAEPEHVTLGEVDGVLHAFVSLERANATMAFRIDGPDDVTYAGLLRQDGDVAPEVSAFIPGTTPVLAVANEASTTVTAFEVVPIVPETFRLQIIHGADFEAGLLATGRADRFAAIVDRLEDALPNSITLSGGDNYLPGPFAAAGTDPTVVPVLRAFYEELLGLPAGTLTALGGSSSPFFAADIAILNAIGIQASVIGNHEFDLGPVPFAAALDFTANTTGATPGARVTNIGAQFPYLSANLDFSNEPALRALFTEALREASTYATTAADIASNAAVAAEAADVQIAPWTTIQVGGETVGVVGLTTQILAAISSVGGVRVLDPAGDGGVDNMAELATIVQPWVDGLAERGINKIILLSHLQQYQNELELAPLLRGVDVIISAGSNALFANPDDALRPGEVPVEPYPVFLAGADGNPVAIVSGTGEFAHVGRLVLDFDAQGVLSTTLDPALNGPIATTDENVAALWGNEDPYAAGTRGAQVRSITDAVGTVINEKDGNVLGFTDVFLEGRRAEVRSQETNLGNLTADANLYVARQVDQEVLVSFKNGGGIRAEIGTIVGQPVPEELPPPANPEAGKPAGGVSQLDIENSLRFNNALSIVGVTAANLERLFEHAVAPWAPTATPGQFAQVGGVAFSFDPAQQSQVISGGAVTREGERIRNLVIVDEDGAVVDVIVRDGVLQGDAERMIKVVTLDFLANGGDGYPFTAFTLPGTRVDLRASDLLTDGAATFAARGTEQDALAEYLAAFHGTPELAFREADTGPAEDERIQNLLFRADTVGQGVAEPPSVTVEVAGGAPVRVPLDATLTFRGSDAAERITGTAGAERIVAGAGNDVILGGGGDDFLDGGRGYDVGVFGGLLDDATVSNNFDGTFSVATAAGTARVARIEELRFDDGTVSLQTRPGDVNGDLRSDILLLNDDGAVGVWAMDGAAITGVAGLGWAPPGAWEFRFKGDMDGDGRADLLWTSAGGNDLWLWTSTGLAETTKSWRAGPTGLELRAQGDTDGDGIADLVWQSGTGEVQSWRMFGLLPTEQNAVGDAGGRTVIAAADFTGNAVADILLRGTDGSIRIWEMDAGLRVGEQDGPTIAARWDLAGTGDLNGDGRADIVWQDDVTGDVLLWQRTETGFDAFEFGLGARWRVADVADLSGEGRADLVLRHDTGAVGLWEMDGFAVTGMSVIGAPGADWRILA